MTSQRESLDRVIRLLDEAEIPYMVAGSVSSGVHGRPRATEDADIVIDPTEEQIKRLLVLLQQGFYVSDAAALDAFRRRTMFNVVDLGGGWKVDLIIRKERPFSLQEFQRRQRLEKMGWRMWVVSPEDAILSKLEWIKGRESDVQYSDALGVVIAQWRNLDLAYLRRWAVELEIEDLLARLLKDARKWVEWKH
mgnify:CR=1 FL=1